MLLMLLLVGTGMLGDPAKANVLIMQGSPGETEARQQEQALANAAREARLNMPQSNVAILPRVKRLRGRGPTPIKVAQGRITTLLFTKSGRAIDPAVVIVGDPEALHVEATASGTGAVSLLPKKMFMSTDLVVHLDRGDPWHLHIATDLKQIHGLVELADGSGPTSLMPSE
ncbi:MAG TPA: hypothetical protein DHV03_02375 [Alphaproteobacteria bacterium]|nr:hypothetical protein [Paracoccaceae bacterium]HCY47504.1 hypothetical protein [Alphaproteobacteria bacterium]